MGSTTDIGGSVDVTVFSFSPTAAAGAPAPKSPGTKYAAADVQVCAKADQISLTSTPWSVVGADNGLYQPASTGYDQFPVPQYPLADTNVANGECVRGWIVFVVPKKSTAVAVRYAPSSAAPIRWTIG